MIMGRPTMKGVMSINQIVAKLNWGAFDRAPHTPIKVLQLLRVPQNFIITKL